MLLRPLLNLPADSSRRFEDGRVRDDGASRTGESHSMMRTIRLVIATCLLSLAGCTGQSQHAQLGQRFLLADEPSGAMGVLDYRETPPETADVTLVGRIGFAGLQWSSHSAMFELRDLSESIEDAASHVCHDENCPFCKGKNGPDQSRAIVALVGDDGQVPPIDARKLLPLAEGQTVVVSGRAEVDEAGQLTVLARGLYVRR
jgi:hypothetical protein